mmetsp:Transcript_24968/g.46040  ORF Transcript_24968/g.46040 Transcript_24968/m.46040 type:complete len:447 (-) Transcript_24968:112-1452(-)
MTSITPSSIRVPFLSLHPNVPQDKNSPPSPPSTLVPKSDFEDAYTPFQALHIRGFVPPPSTISSSKCGDGIFDACDVQPLFESLNNQDKESWCIENEANHSQTNGQEKAGTSPNEFLNVDKKNQQGYCSFLVQHSEMVMKDLISNRLPMVHLPVANKSETAKNDDTMKVHYGPCLWLFFGKNYIDDGGSSSSKPPPATLQGRPEHTDSVTHDGTWHYQLSGTKIWRLRPTTELMKRMKEHKQKEGREQPLSGTKRKIDDADGDCNNEKVEETIVNYDDADKKYIEVECKQGDILLLNTQLWWHSTLIPPQDVPCISYARDIYFSNTEAAAADEDGQEREKHIQLDQQKSSMTNIDGTYAADDIEAETLLFTEHTMPDCELHRSKTDPNCQVVELEDEKTGESYMAVVSLRDIKAGEFFCMLESDDEEESGSEEEIEEWEEDDSEEE